MVRRNGISEGIALKIRFSARPLARAAFSFLLVAMRLELSSQLARSTVVAKPNAYADGRLTKCRRD